MWIHLLADACISSVLFQIVLPLMSNEKNHDSWPKVISDDLVRHVYGMKNKVHVVNGLTKGATLLPMPAGTERLEDIETELATFLFFYL